MRVGWGMIFGYWITAVLLIAVGQDGVAVSAEPTAADMVVAVIGTGKLQGNDVDGARDQAVAIALVNAIDRAVSDLMPVTARTERFQSLEKTLFSNPDRFVVNYKILTEAMSGKTYRILLEATVSIATLRKTLGEGKMLPEATALKRVLLLIAEQNLSDSSPKFWWGPGQEKVEGACEARVKEVMRRQETQIIISPEAVSPAGDEKPGNPPVSIGASPSDAEAAAFGKRFSADTIVVATATVQNIGNTMGETNKSFKGVFTGRVIRTDTGEKIADIARSAVAIGPDPVQGGRQALAEVGTLVGETLNAPLKTVAQKQPHAIMSATLVVEGTRQLSNFVNFRNVLKNMPMVREVETTGIKPNEATVLIQLQGTTQALADALMPKSMDAFSIQISEIKQNYIHLSLVPK